MADYVPAPALMPWQDEQAQMDAAGAPQESPVASPGDMTPPEIGTPTVTVMGADAWRQPTPGPAGLSGNALIMRGGTPTAPQPFSAGFDQYNREREQFLEQKRIEDIGLRAGPFADQAIERAMRLEGQLGLASDIKAGVPMPQALMKWAPKIYWKNPQGLSSLIRAEQAMKPPFLPSETTVGGQKLVQMSPNRWAFQPRASEPPITSRITGINAELRSLGEEIKALDAVRTTPEVTRQKAVLTQRKRDLTASLAEMNDALRKPSSTTKGTSGNTIRVRHKKSGKTGTWNGAVETVPTDQYEVIQ